MRFNSWTTWEGGEGLTAELQWLTWNPDALHGRACPSRRSADEAVSHVRRPQAGACHALLLMEDLGGRGGPHRRAALAGLGPRRLHGRACLSRRRGAVPRPAHLLGHRLAVHPGSPCSLRHTEDPRRALYVRPMEKPSTIFASCYTLFEIPGWALGLV